MRIGIDLGGTKIEGVILDASREVARLRVDTPRGDYSGTVEAVAALVGRLEREAGARATVGVGIPGALTEPAGLVKNANSTWLIGRPLRADLERRLAREVRMANDANCFAVSEAADGAAAGADVVFGVIVGTGTGAGIVVGGRLVIGVNGIAGEWGHNPLPEPTDQERPGPQCYCGRRGCVETFLSGPGMEGDYQRECGRTLSSREIVAAAAVGERDAEAAIGRYESRMARALAGIINVIDPDVIVLGGGMSKIDRLYDNVPRLWARHVFRVTEAKSSDTSTSEIKTRLVRATHGDASGVRGAAWLWPLQ